MLLAPQTIGDPQCRVRYLELEVPIEFHDPLLRHHANLVDLAATLRDAGVPEPAVAEQIDALIESYREALLQAVSDRKQAHHD